MPATHGSWYVVKKNASNQPIWGKQSDAANAECGLFKDSSRSSTNLGDLNNVANRSEVGMNIGGSGFDLPFLCNASIVHDAGVHHISFNDFNFATAENVTTDVLFIFRKSGAGSIYLGFVDPTLLPDPSASTNITNIATGALWTRQKTVLGIPTQVHDNFYYRPTSNINPNTSSLDVINAPANPFPQYTGCQEKPDDTINRKDVPIPTPTRWQVVRFRITNTQNDTTIAMNTGDFREQNMTNFYNLNKWTHTGRIGSDPTYSKTIPLPQKTFVPVISFGKSSELNLNTANQLHGIMINQF